jgi:hypothetical protein
MCGKYSLIDCFRWIYVNKTSEKAVSTIPVKHDKPVCIVDSTRCVSVCEFVHTINVHW